METNDFINRSRQAHEGESPSGRQRQQELGKLSARERINRLCDHHSFEEIDLLARSIIYPDAGYTDGVICGFARIDQRPIALFSQDFSIKGGSLGKRHAEKIVKVMTTASKIGCPIIGLLDSGGARIDEGIHALSGYGSIFMNNVRLSGVVPQISLILGPCAGGAVYSPALTDIIIMTEKMSHMFITGPQIVEKMLQTPTNKEMLGGTTIHASQSGVAHLIGRHEADVFRLTKKLLSYLPDNYLTPVPRTIPRAPAETNITNILPSSNSSAYDMHTIIEAIIDDQSFFELQSTFAPNIIIGFGRLDGYSVGIVANQPLHYAGALDIHASCKAARFINFCNAFGIPMISFVDVPGFLPGTDQESAGIIRHGAKLLYAYAHATVPKITIIIRKAFGGAYIVMGSKELGADFNYAWPQAEIAVLGPEAAAIILHKPSLSDDTNAYNHFIETYRSKFLHPYIAAEAGYIDAIIEPNHTRKHIIKALALLNNKVEKSYPKKSGNIPL